MVTSSVLFVCFFFEVFDLYIMSLSNEDEICELSGLHLHKLAILRPESVPGWSRNLEQFAYLFLFPIVDGETEMQ